MKQVIVNIVKSTSAIVIVAILLFSTVSFLAAASPNYARSTELNWLEFKGYVQIQPSYRELRSGGLYHAARGQFNYRNTQDNSVYYTSWGNSKTDNKIYSREKIVNDSLNLWAPDATFHYDFYWVDTTLGGVWPVSQPVFSE